jgi:hypothetical protein
VLFILYVNDMPVPPRHVELALYVGDTVIIAMSRKYALLIRYLETYLSNLDRWLREWNIAINVSKINAMLFAKVSWRIRRPRRIQFLGQPIKCGDTARYLGVTLDSSLNWSPHIVQLRKKSSQRLVMLGCLLNRSSSLSIRNCVLLYRQLIRIMVDYACLIRRCAARNYFMQLQALHSKCLRIATGAPWYINNRQIHEDLRVPYFGEHTRALTESYDSKLAGVGNPLVRQLGRYLHGPTADGNCLNRKLRDQLTSRGRMQNGGEVDLEKCFPFTS